jgi:hypothetical protein
MVEQFGDAALRHLGTAELLEEEGRTDDAAYHYGLVGEMALKAALIKVLGQPLPNKLADTAKIKRSFFHDLSHPIHEAWSFGVRQIAGAHFCSDFRGAAGGTFERV